MKRKILGFLFALCLIVPSGVMLTACGEDSFTITANAQNAQITLQTTEAKQGDRVTFDVVASEMTDDYVYELDRVYYIVEGSTQENVLASETSTYSFEMPEGNVTIYADVNQRAIYKDVSIFKGSLTSYYGSETDIVIPATYSLYDTESNERIIKLNSTDEIIAFEQGKNYLTYLSGQYYVTPTIGSETLEETFVSASQVETYFDNLIQTANSSSQNLSVEIRLTSYVVNIGDVVTEAHLGAFMRPFIEVSQGYLSSFTMKTKDAEYTITQENYEEQMSLMETIFSDGFTEDDLPITYTYGNYYLITEGDDYQITNIATNPISDEAAYSDLAIESIVIPSTITNISSGTFDNCNSLTSVLIESAAVYNSLTDLSACGNLISNATTIKVLKTIVGDVGNSNEFLNTTGGYVVTEEGDYYIYSK